MPQFRVPIHELRVWNLEVEAEDENDAINRAHEIAAELAENSDVSPDELGLELDYESIEPQGIDAEEI